MSVDEDPLLNSTSRTRRSVEILTLLNKATSDTLKVYLLHLHTIMNIGLPLKEPNPRFVDDHAAVCKGLHDFALQTHQLAAQFQLYSQTAFSHLLKNGIGADEENETADNRVNAPVVPTNKPAAVSLSEVHIDVDKIPLPGEVITDKMAPSTRSNVRNDNVNQRATPKQERSSSFTTRGHDTFSSNSLNNSLRRVHDGSERHSTPSKKAHY